MIRKLTDIPPTPPPPKSGIKEFLRRERTSRKGPRTTYDRAMTLTENDRRKTLHRLGIAYDEIKLDMLSDEAWADRIKTGRLKRHTAERLGLDRKLTGTEESRLACLVKKKGWARELIPYDEIADAKWPRQEKSRLRKKQKAIEDRFEPYRPPAPKRPAPIRDRFLQQERDKHGHFKGLKERT